MLRRLIHKATLVALTVLAVLSAVLTISPTQTAQSSYDEMGATQIETYVLEWRTGNIRPPMIELEDEHPHSSSHYGRYHDWTSGSVIDYWSHPDHESLYFAERTVYRVEYIHYTLVV